MQQTGSTDPVVKFIAEVRWRFAKTMPQWPHWYVMKYWNPGREPEFIELVRRIFEEGRDEQWGVGTAHIRVSSRSSSASVSSRVRRMSGGIRREAWGMWRASRATLSRDAS